MPISIDSHINQAAQATHGRSYGEFTGQQARALVVKLRSEGLHPDADTLWSWILRDEIALVAQDGNCRAARGAKRLATSSAA